LNMSHVSKKDREAARMLLGFSTPSSTEVSSTLHSFPASHHDSTLPGCLLTSAPAACTSQASAQSC
jgi:hypothetical protein